MAFNLDRFVSFNTLFQSDIPLLYMLKSEVNTLLISLLSDINAKIQGQDKMNPALTKVVTALLSLPFSNTAVECVFSRLKLHKNYRRSALKQLKSFCSTSQKKGKWQASTMDPTT